MKRLVLQHATVERPAIVADMERWNAIAYMSGLLPQYQVLGVGTHHSRLMIGLARGAMSRRLRGAFAWGLFELWCQQPDGTACPERGETG